MKNKIFNLVLITLMSSILLSNVFGYSQEIARATAHYSHPVSGVIEDPGNNPGIGQGMTENVLSPQALVETTDDGRIFLSVRYSLKEYIKNETFAVQNKGENNFYKVSAKITGETSETKDYRFEIPSKNVIVRTSFFVQPMGRDVIFYYDLSNFTPGNTDFKTLEKTNVSKIESNEDVAEVNNKETNANLQVNFTSSPSKAVNESINSQKTQSNELGEKVENKAVNDKFSQASLGYSHGLLTKDSPEIQKLFYQDGENSESKEKVKKDKRPLGKVTMAFIYLLLGIIGILTSISIVASILVFIFYRKAENDLNIKREEVYFEEDIK